MATKKLKKVRPQRDMEVPAMRMRNGKGAHRDNKKHSNHQACRGRVFLVED